jgi:hypothetical protein
MMTAVVDGRRSSSFTTKEYFQRRQKNDYSGDECDSHSCFLFFPLMDRPSFLYVIQMRTARCLDDGNSSHLKSPLQLSRKFMPTSCCYLRLGA